MEAWVIKRKDGLYFWWEDYYNYGFDDAFIFNRAMFFISEDSAYEIIAECGLKNCHPVKVRIEEVYDETN